MHKTVLPILREDLNLNDHLSWLCIIWYSQSCFYLCIHKVFLLSDNFSVGWAALAKAKLNNDAKNYFDSVNLALCLSNYPLKIICLSNLVNTFCDLFCRLFMSPNCPVSHMKTES